MDKTMNDWQKRRDERIAIQADAAIKVCEKYGYPDHDEPLACLIDDTAKFIWDACRADMLKHLDEVPEVRAMREAIRDLMEYIPDHLMAYKEAAFTLAQFDNLASREKGGKDE